MNALCTPESNDRGNILFILSVLDILFAEYSSCLPVVVIRRKTHRPPNISGVCHACNYFEKFFVCFNSSTLATGTRNLYIRTLYNERTMPLSKVGHSPRLGHVIMTALVSFENNNFPVTPPLLYHIQQLL